MYVNKKKDETYQHIIWLFTSRVQVVDVSVNKPFKDDVRYQFEEHLDKNVNRYMKGDTKVRERRILLTQWVTNAWSHLCSKREMIQRSFKKGGLNNALMEVKMGSSTSRAYLSM